MNAPTTDPRPARRRIAWGSLVAAAYFVAFWAAAAPSDANPDLIRGPTPATGCKQCHEQEVEAWKVTHHHDAKKVLTSKEGKAVVTKLGMKGLPLFNELCQTCHVTMYSDGGASKKAKAKWGVSCESCHGASKDWIEVHGKLAPFEKPEDEPAEHRAKRLADAQAAGMILPSDIFSIASNCFSCHTVPQENLVNAGGHSAGSAEFELLSWSQGEVRHRFLRGNGNKPAPASRHRILYVVGQMADLAGSLTSLSTATTDGAFSKAMVVRVKNAKAALGKIAAALGDSDAGKAVKEIADAVPDDAVKHGNADALSALAATLSEKGKAFAAAYQGKDALGSVDPLLPTARQGKPLGN